MVYMAFAVLVANLKNNATKSHDNPLHYAHKLDFAQHRMLLYGSFHVSFQPLVSYTFLFLQCVAYLSWPQNYAKLLPLE